MLTSPLENKSAVLPGGSYKLSDSKNFFSNHSNLEQFKSPCFHEVLCVGLGGFVWCFTQNVLEKNQIVTAHDSVPALES